MKKLEPQSLSTHQGEAGTGGLEKYLNHSLSLFAILIGRDLVFKFANAPYVQMMNNRQLVGKTMEEAIPELKGQPYLEILQGVFDTGEPYHVTEIPATAIFYENTEPTTRYFNISYTPFTNSNDEIEGVVAMGNDVTEQVELRRAANKSMNIQAYNLFMQAPVGFSLLRGENHVIELANSSALRFTRKDESAIGKPIADVLPEIESQGYIQLLNRVLKNGESFHLRESPVMLIKDGKPRAHYLNIVYQPYYEDKKIVGVLSIQTDVTEQVLARKATEAMREQFETMANNIPVLAWIANADGWIFWYNTRWYEYTGTTPEQMEGWGWKSVHDPEVLPSVLIKWQKSIDTGEPFEMVFPIKGADSTFRPFLTRIIPIKDHEGKVIRWLGTNTDIARQKELEQMKDDFLSITSHELKTPVTTIKAYGQIAEGLLAKKGDLETLGMIQKMGTQVKKLTTLIEELLDITKIQKGRLVYKEEFFDFNQLVNEVVEDMQKTSSTHQIYLHFESSAEVFGDRDKISQVINNLISNAIKYSPGAERIIIRSENKADGMQLSVQDFGIGIGSAEKTKVFEQFYRVGGESQTTFPGMGIGLFISSEIVRRHGGKIWVESMVKQGSTFFVWLPFDHRTAQ